MKRLLALLIGGLGLRALLRSRRPAPAPLKRPADDLRQKLAEARATVEEQIEETESAETRVDDRRADVHARARKTIDELRDESE